MNVNIVASVLNSHPFQKSMKEFTLGKNFMNVSSVASALPKEETLQHT